MAQNGIDGVLIRIFCQCISLTKGNNYEQNLALKFKLNEIFNQADEKRKRELVDYYIRVWGGIIANKPDQITYYANTPTEEILTNQGLKGVASWSKAAVIENPEKYAIYDARVALSLNVLQVINGVEDTWFPLLVSRNNKVKAGNEDFKKYLYEKGFRFLNKRLAYDRYIELLSEVAEKTGQHIQSVEMLLFAQVEELLDEMYKT